MSIIVTEQKGNRSGGWSLQGGRTYSITCRVETDNPLIGPRAAMRSVGVDAGAFYRFPLSGTALEWDYAAFLNSIDAREIADDGMSWDVTLAYAQISPKDQAGGDGEGANAGAFILSPFAVKPSVQWGSETEEIARTHDRAGQPILNTAGDPFDPPLSAPVSNPVATIVRNLRSYDGAWVGSYKDHVNQSVWMGYPAGTVLCKDITGESVYDTDWGWYWRVTYQFAFRPIWVEGGKIILPGWATQVLNAGMRQLKSGEVKQILVEGAPTSTPIPLKENGEAATPTDDPHYLTFDVYPEADFDDLDLPPDLFSRSSVPGGGGS